ncbi:MAG: NYN domain-containing protein [Candidatus Hodarchaeales archaeon]|jgi:hypothetical protein
MVKEKRIIIDGDNVLLHRSQFTSEKAQQLIIMMDYLQENGYNSIICIIKKKTRHCLSEKDQDVLKELIKVGKVIEAPAGSDSDQYILEIANKFDCSIISNDLFRNYLKAYPDAFLRRISFLILKNHVFIPNISNSSFIEV